MIDTRNDYKIQLLDAGLGTGATMARLREYGRATGMDFVAHKRMM